VNKQRQQNVVSKDERLLDLMAEQMKLPLIQIARSAELAQMSKARKKSILNSIELTADSALQLIDNYLLSTKLIREQAYLHLEPVSVAAVLNETAHRLEKLARQHDCELELHLGGRYEPVMAHREGLEAALTSLGYVFIESQSRLKHEKRPVLKMAAHRSNYGIVTGIFADMEGLSTDMYRRARHIYGQARQPLTQLSASSGAGVFVADSLLNSMSTHLRIAHHQKMTGLAATFSPSHQLSMV